jgi:TetR/AcrR family transcriptional regulator, transcriptional repressor for nem operon
MARPRTFDESDVVEAARNEFWNRGYAATSVDDLAAATGLGKGSLYGAFGDKHALFLRALDAYCVATADRVSAQLRAVGVPAFERLANHVRAVVADTVDDTERRGCLMTRSSAELGGSDEEVDRIVGRSMRRWHADLVGCLVEAQGDGTVRSADPRTLATMVLAQLRGFEVLRKGGTEPAQLEAAAEQMLALIAR